MLTFERSLKYSNSHPYSGFKKTKKSCSSTEAPTQKKSPFYTQVITGTHIYENILQSASDIPLCVWLPGRYSTALQTSAYTKPDRKILNRRRETVALWSRAKVNKSVFSRPLQTGEGGVVLFKNAPSTHRSSCGYENTLCKQFIQHHSDPNEKKKTFQCWTENVSVTASGLAQSQRGRELWSHNMIIKPLITQLNITTLYICLSKTTWTAWWTNLKQELLSLNQAPRQTAVVHMEAI